MDVAGFQLIGSRRHSMVLPSSHRGFRSAKIRHNGWVAELVSERTREIVRDMMSGTTLREIDEMWMDEGFSRAEDPEPIGGQRVTRFQGYMNLVDWADAQQVDRALAVFEVATRDLYAEPTQWMDVATRDRMRQRYEKAMRRDGFGISPNGSVARSLADVVNSGALDHLEDPAAILEHLRRISNALAESDARLVIGSAKELVESTAKIVLRARGVEFSEKDNMPALIARTQESLGLRKTAGKSSPDGSDAVVKILGGAATVAAGLGELRNRGWGTGHGSDEVRAGLGIRHARMAVNAARLWCELVLDTLADPDAPWRNA